MPTRWGAETGNQSSCCTVGIGEGGGAIEVKCRDDIDDLRLRTSKHAHSVLGHSQGVGRHEVRHCRQEMKHQLSEQLACRLSNFVSKTKLLFVILNKV